MSFINVQPCPILITASADRLTRLDIGHVFTFLEDTLVPLTPCLEVLSITPIALSSITDSPPPTLHVVIIKHDDFGSFSLFSECTAFLAKCTGLTSLAIVDTAPEDSQLVLLLNQLLVPIPNICFQFFHPDIDTVNNLYKKLPTTDTSFQFCTFLLPISPRTDNLRDDIQGHCNLVAEKFHLDACFVGCDDGRLIYDTKYEEHRHLLVEWMHLVDEK
ncbi:hypothetical protein BYT27DRAFT_7252711 [Phlegmacium glaucopus]|nr:hypothetical protein BYT27DRAFT_7252711 [Phlegmacium glaucopus]